MSDPYALAAQVHRELDDAGSWPFIYLERVHADGSVSTESLGSWRWEQRSGGERYLVLSSVALRDPSELLALVVEEADSLSPLLRAMVRAAVAGQRHD